MREILAVNQLTRYFGGLAAVRDVTFQVKQGEILGLIGPNGSGKTTLFNLLMGLVKASSGSIALGGQALAGFKPHQICRLGMVKTFQNVALFPEMTVLENVVTGAVVRMPVAQAADLAKQNLDRVGLTGVMTKQAADLSFPEKALVEMARALCTNARVVLLDEVMAALNETEMDKILDLIRSLREREGITFIVIEHHMRAIMRLCDRVVVLNFGEKIAEGTPREVARSPAVIDTYLGNAARGEAAA